MEGPSFVIGNIAKGEDFWDREDVIDDIWQALNKNNIILKAPRRFGKTSVMNSLFESPQDNFKVFFIDTESMREPEDFISGLVTLLLEDTAIRSVYSASKFLKGLIAKVEVGVHYEGLPEIRVKIKEALKKDWQEEGQKLISSLKDFDGNILVILDELPELIKHIERKRDKNTAIDFLSWFRAIRQMPKLSRVRWLVGGSIGIEHVLLKTGAGISTINDFENISIGPFTVSEAKKYIRELLKSEGQMSRIADSTILKLLDVIGAPVPYFIQIVLKECLYEMTRQGRRAITPEIIKKAYQAGVLGPTNRNYFEHYYTRLREYFDADTERVAKKLLLEIARKGVVRKPDLYRLFRQLSKGKKDESEFSHLMSDLENDFYISCDAESASYCFSTKVLRDWWLRYYDLVEE